VGRRHVATMAEIARRAGVSLSTVSYALSGKRPISEATRRRVLQAVEELDFQPHAVGRALASRRSKTIALFFPSLARGISEGVLEFLTNAAETAAQHGYSFLFSTSPPEDSEILRMVRQGFVDGLILMEVKLHDPRVALLKERNYPFALIGHCADNTGISFVDLDFAHAVATAVAHLAELGHRRIAFVNVSRDLHEAGYGPAVRSIAGFERALAAHGVEGIARLCLPVPAAGYEIVEELLTADPNLSAIVTINREAIGGMLQAIADRGLRIPDDLSLVGVVSERLAGLYSPALTTLNFPAAEMGRRGAELLIRQLEGGGAEPVHCLLQAELAVRQTTGPYRPRG
jgi:DNA-binding LacI/PurR family transcriptional regulator